MFTVDLQKVHQHEFYLLNHDGPSLGSFHVSEPNQEAIFISPTYQTKQFLHIKFHIFPQSIRTIHTSVNSPLKIFACLLLKIFFQREKNYDLLQHLKCILYSPDIDMNQIKNKPNKQLSSDSMKKILIEFFQIMQYNNTDVQTMLKKYPIVIQIFILFFRTILKKAYIENIQDFSQQFQPNETMNILFDYFDLDYHMSKGLYLLQDAEFFVFIDNDISKENKNIAYGYYKDKNHENMEKNQSKPLLQNILQNKFQNEFNFHTNDSVVQNPQMIDSNLIQTPHFQIIQQDELSFKNCTPLKLKSSKQIQKIIELDQDDNDQKKTNNQSKSNYKSNLQEQKQLEKSLIKSKSNNQDFINNGNYIKSKQFNSVRLKKYSHDGILVAIRDQNKSTRSDFFNKKQKPTSNKFPFKNMNELSVSTSCVCCSARHQKNYLQSQVIDINYCHKKQKFDQICHQQNQKKPFTAFKSGNQNTLAESKQSSLKKNQKSQKKRFKKKINEKGNKKTYKIPQFLLKKFKQKSFRKSQKKSKSKINTQPSQRIAFQHTPQKLMKPKIIFTFDEYLKYKGVQSSIDLIINKPTPIKQNKKNAIRQMRYNYKKQSQMINGFRQNTSYPYRRQNHKHFLVNQKNDY